MSKELDPSGLYDGKAKVEESIKASLSIKDSPIKQKEQVDLLSTKDLTSKSSGSKKANQAKKKPSVKKSKDAKDKLNDVTYLSKRTMLRNQAKKAGKGKTASALSGGEGENGEDNEQTQLVQKSQSTAEKIKSASKNARQARRFMQSKKNFGSGTGVNSRAEMILGKRATESTRDVGKVVKNTKYIGKGTKDLSVSGLKASARTFAKEFFNLKSLALKGLGAIGGTVGAVILIVVVFMMLIFFGVDISQSSSGDTTSGGLSGNAALIYKEIKKQDPKATNEGIAAVLGNFQQESGLDPNAVNEIGASGIGQWLGGRAAELHAYADKKGQAWNSIPLQIDYMFHDDGSNSTIAKQCVEEKDVTQATSDFYYQWERPGSDTTLAKRIDYAKLFLSQMNSGNTGAGKIPPMGMPGNPYPEYNYYNPDGSGNASGSCTSFVWAYFKQNLNVTIPTYAGNAGAWVVYGNSTCKVNVLAVFPPGVQGAGDMGHVAVVTKVNSDGTFDVVEGGWEGCTPPSAGWGHTRSGLSTSGVTFVDPRK